MARPGKTIQTFPDPDEGRSTLELIEEVIPDHETWMRARHPLLGAKAPQDLLGQPEESVLRTLVLGLKDGSFS